MKEDLVIGIDSSTTATKATAWSRDGVLVGEGRMPIPLSNPSTGRFEQDPGDWWSSTVGALRLLLADIDASRVAALSISNQRETFAVFDEQGEPVRQGLVWLDERAIEQTEVFGKEFGGERIHSISGKPVDTIVPLYRMIWLKEHEPEHFARIARYSDVHCYLAYKLIGEWITSVASADPSGMLDMVSGSWSELILASAGIPLTCMPSLAKPGDVIGRVSEAAASETGLRLGTPVVAGGGDGQCAACGAGAVQPSHAYMNLGTAIVTGAYSPAYDYDLAFRTEFAVSDSGYIFETVLKSGTFLIDWFARELGGVADKDRTAFLNQLEEEAQASPIGSGGIATLPFWQGSMTPHWDPQARGVIAGLSGSTKRGDIYRSLLEGFALDQAYALERAVAYMHGDISRVIAIGGGTASKLLLQIIADVLNIPVYRSEVAEASALGAAMCAAKGAGWYQSLNDASSAMSQKDLSVTNPIPNNAARYRELREVYDELWPCLAEWNQKLWSFANKT